MKIAFLDRDGTIVKDYPDKEWQGKVVPEVLIDATEGMKLLNQLGYEMIIVTNQYIINEGIISQAEYEAFTKNLELIFRAEGVHVLDIFFCPHATSENCNCKKPKTGMIKAAFEKYPSIDLKNSIMIGDSESDAEMANQMRLPFYRVVSSILNGDGDAYASIKEIAIKLSKGSRKMEQI